MVGKETAKETDDAPGPLTLETPVDEIDDAEVVQESSEEPVPEPAQTPEPVRPSEPEDRPRQYTGFLVGLVALVVGGAIVYFFQPVPENNQAEIERLAAQIDRLSKSVSEPKSDTGTADAVDRLEGAIADQLGGLGSTIGGLTERLEEVDARMANLEAVPAGTPAELADALQSLRDDLRSWQAEAERLRAENAALTKELTAKNKMLEAAALAAQTTQSELDALSQETRESDQARAAGVIARIEAAVIAGKPFSEFSNAYVNVTENPLPVELSRVADLGVWSVGQLQSAFPELARSALTQSLEQRENRGLLERSGDFLRAQLGVRSVVPREGTSTDAVLSRAQGAVDRADFSDALAEIEGLDPNVQPPLAEWVKQATLRIEAVKSIDNLVSTSE